MLRTTVVPVSSVVATQVVRPTSLRRCTSRVRLSTSKGISAKNGHTHTQYIYIMYRKQISLARAGCPWSRRVRGQTHSQNEKESPDRAKDSKYMLIYIYVFILKKRRSRRAAPPARAHRQARVRRLGDAQSDVPHPASPCSGSAIECERGARSRARAAPPPRGLTCTPCP